MRRIVMVIGLAAFLAGSVGIADAGPKKSKKVPKPYTLELSYDHPAIGTAGYGAGYQVPTFVTNGTHRFLTAEIKDDLSPTPHGYLAWDTDGDGVNDTGITVCGATDQALELPTNTTVSIIMWALPGPECAGFSTSGTVTLTLAVKA